MNPGVAKAEMKTGRLNRRGNVKLLQIGQSFLLLFFELSFGAELLRIRAYVSTSTLIERSSTHEDDKYNPEQPVLPYLPSSRPNISSAFLSHIPCRSKLGPGRKTAGQALAQAPGAPGGSGVRAGYHRQHERPD
jgi:hypothetical protein